jgi:two-component system chemotaxis response regulator CheY
MAVDTRPWVLVPFAAPKGAELSGGAGSGRAGRTKARASKSTQDSHPPDRDDDRDADTETVSAPSEAQQLTADVLVVDDEADVRWTVAEVLRSAGFSVAEAEDGEVAFGLLTTGHYRMVLLDIKMPKRDGVALIDAVGTVPPVVVHSAYSLDASERERMGDRVVGYLHKPVSPQKLLRAVEGVLDPDQES